MIPPIFSHYADNVHSPVFLGGKAPTPVFVAPPVVEIDCEDD